jgi:iron-sulfur cluster protein
MWPFRRRSRLIRSALRDPNLQRALERASNHHRRQVENLEAAIPLEELKAKARSIREECLSKLPALIKEFSLRAIEAGAQVHLAVTPQEALSHVKEIIDRHQAKLLLKAKSMVSEEIGLNSFLEKHGLEVVETDLGEWIVQLAKERPSHITAPALHKTKEEIASLLSRHLGRTVPPDPKEITKAAREYMRPLFLQADIGLTGANLAVAESGTLVIISNEGNARLVSSLPPVHIAIITVDKIVATLEQATTLLKALVASASGRRLTSYVSFITGPSSTTDIEKEPVTGAHGPRELHIILLDNGRTALSEDANYREILTCLKCGGCMLVCPVFQALGGHVFGGPVYPGGIGLLLTSMTRRPKEVSRLLSLCADCKKCENFCPVGLHSGELIARLKSDLGPSWSEKVLSRLMPRRRLQDRAIRWLSLAQRVWAENNHLRPLPLAWTKEKRLPLLQPRSKKFLREEKEPPEPKKGPRVYLFEGCLGRWFFPEIREKTTLWLKKAGYVVVSPDDQVCCGAPNFHLGDKKALTQLSRQNLASWEREKPEAILTFCPTGQHVLSKVYPEIEPASQAWSSRVFDFITWIQKSGLSLVPAAFLRGQAIFYHAPCHLVANGQKVAERIALFQKAGLTVVAEGKESSCCGFCGIFSFRHPEVAHRLWTKKKTKIKESGSRIIITECPGCLFQLRAGLAQEFPPFQVFHLAEIVEGVLPQEKGLSLSGGQ